MKVSLKTMIPATMMALSAMTMSSCIGCGTPVKEKEKERTEQISNYAAQIAPFDTAKANLPIIEGDRVIFRNEDGDIITIKSDDDAGGQITQSLYKAIRKFSTPENPNITSSEKFYSEISKYIPKNFQSGIYNSNVHNGYHELIQGFLNKLFDIYAEDDSEGGTTITVREYTQMMDAWSSTGVRE